MQMVRIGAGALEAELLPEVGARLHRLRAFGHDLLRTPDDPAKHVNDPFFWGAYVLAPWANRIDARSTRVGERVVDVPSNFPDGSAIHGLVYNRAWERRGGGFGIDVDDASWPWRCEVTLRASAEDDVLRLELALVNRSDVPMPAGVGLHPWWRRPLEVRIPAESVYPTTTDSPPLPERVAGNFDHRQLGPMVSGFDAVWTDFSEPVVELRWPDSGVSLTLRVAAPTLHLVAASPPHIDAVAVEPQTHAPQGLRRLLNGEPGALTLLEPGETLALHVELEARLEGR